MDGEAVQPFSAYITGVVESESHSDSVQETTDSQSNCNNETLPVETPQSPYQALDPGQFRVVRFLDSVDADTIRCELLLLSIGKTPADRIAYSALSYTWGDHEKTEVIELNGIEMPVGWSLYYALRHLRSQYHVLWIDALCIDQNSLQEREQQVAGMGEIYTNATRVVIWLGAATYETDEFMDSMTRLETDVAQRGHRWADSDPQWRRAWLASNAASHTADPRLLSLQCTGLKDLLARSWFTRVRIIQEVALSTSAIVACGTKSISGKTFSLAPSMLDVSIGQHRRVLLDIMPGRSKEDTWWNGPRDLLTLLCLFNRCQASEARDRIFALYGMSTDNYLTKELPIDYRSSDQEIIERTLHVLFGTGFHPYSGRSVSWESLLKYPSISSMLQDIVVFKAKLIAKAEEDLNVHKPSATHLGSFTYETVRFLLSHDQAEKVVVTSETVLDCILHNSDRNQILQLLLDQRPSQVHITPEIVLKSARNKFSGMNLLRLLLDRRPDEVQITHELWMTAFSEGSGSTVKLLLDRSGDTIQITNEVFRAIVSNWGSDAKDMIHLLQERQPGELLLTESVLIAAVRNEFNHAETLVELLVSGMFGEVEITEDVMQAAAGRPGSGYRILEVLRACHGKAFNITEGILVAAAAAPSDGFFVNNGNTLRMLLEQQVGRIEVTEPVVLAALMNSRVSRYMVDSLRNYDEQQVEEIIARLPEVYKARFVMEGDRVVAIAIDPECPKEVVSHHSSRV